MNITALEQKLICKTGKDTDCTIEICHNLLQNPTKYLHLTTDQLAIITDDNVAVLYGKVLQQNLQAIGLNAKLFVFPHGEQNKTRSNKEFLENQLLASGFGRDSGIIALGGGVVTDLAGYIAATYCRGVSLTMLPTSLLGMVDASIGGKTGLNVPEGKNMIGCIYHPKQILIDTAMLKTLPLVELANGMAEVIKHSLISDNSLFEYLETHVQELLALEPTVLEQVIFANCHIKWAVVQSDENGYKKRHILNFGHTIGHALECVTNYSIPHGQAVALGILAESYLCVELGALEQTSFARIENILLQYGLPLSNVLDFKVEQVIDVMRLDKKSLNGQPRFVIIDAIGSPRPYEGNYCTPIPKVLIEKALHWLIDNNALRRH